MSQTDGRLAGWVQCPLVSIVHVGEHPSLEAVLLSSQASLEAFIPSPHVDEHTEGLPVHVNPYSTEQLESHPSKLAGLLSQPSFEATIKSPQTEWQATFGVGQ